MIDAAACCAEFYEQDWVAALIGESYHPGGVALSRRAVTSLELPAGARVLDVGCGLGTTATTLAVDLGLRMVGVDASEKNVARANGSSSAEFVCARAQSLPFDDGSFDAALSECVVSTLEQQDLAAGELARVIRPGGRLAISDVVVNGTIPPELSAAIGPWACVDGALTLEGYQQVFANAGFRPLCHVDETDSLVEMALEAKRRLAMLGLGKLAGAPALADLDVAQTRRLIDDARDLVRAGIVQYHRLSFER